MGRYLEDARKLYAHAVKELGDWERTRDQTLLRDAAEKAWGAMVQATNEVLDAYGGRIPSGTNARRDALHAVERQNKPLRRLRLEARFLSAENVLHKDCFYDGACSLPLVSDLLTEDVKEYLDDVADLTGTNGR